MKFILKNGHLKVSFECKYIFYTETKFSIYIILYTYLIYRIKYKLINKIDRQFLFALKKNYDSSSAVIINNNHDEIILENFNKTDKIFVRFKIIWNEG